jgi:hypothetical protein
MECEFIPLVGHCLEFLFKGFQKEAIQWKYLEHPNILPLVGISLNSFESDRLALVSSFMENSNILQYLDKEKKANKLSLVCLQLFLCLDQLFMFHLDRPMCPRAKLPS